ncbi:MAG: Ulp1 protease family, C-terminal catalytic domain [Mucilaginibacter sp.]|nr:Ulp1 protease family, C-terminal catalytic domain [Mucilaginibacter sp.]
MRKAVTSKTNRARIKHRRLCEIISTLQRALVISNVVPFTGPLDTSATISEDQLPTRAPWSSLGTWDDDMIHLVLGQLMGSHGSNELQTVSSLLLKDCEAATDNDVARRIAYVEKVLVPIHLAEACHWVLMVLERSTKSVFIYDSIPGPGHRAPLRPLRLLFHPLLTRRMLLGLPASFCRMPTTVQQPRQRCRGVGGWPSRCSQPHVSHSCPALVQAREAQLARVAEAQHTLQCIERRAISTHRNTRIWVDWKVG